MNREIIKLKNLCNIKTGKKDVNEGNPNGKYPFFTCAKKHTYSHNYSFDCEAILVAGNGDVGQTSYFKGKFEAYQRTYVLSDFKKVLPKLLKIILQGFLMNHLKSKVLGNTIPYIKKGMLENFEIELPAIAEQKKILSNLELIFAQIDKAIKINVNKFNYIDVLKNCILNNQLGNNLIKLGDACDLIRRGISPKYLKTGGISVINQKCIRNHKIDYSKARRHNINLKKIPEERFVRKGDVLINSTGHGTLGRVAQVLREPLEKTTVDSHVTIVRPNKNLFNLSFFKSSLIKIEKQLEAAGEGTSGQTELSRSRLENEFFISYVDDIDKQKKISLLLDSMFESTFVLKNLTTKILENMKVLKSSFLLKELDNKTI